MNDLNQIFKKNKLVCSIVGTTALALSSPVFSVTHVVLLEGWAINKSAVITNVPGVLPGALPPLYQSPRLAAFGPGPGWASTLSINIDGGTGNVTSFLQTLTTSILVSSAELGGEGVAFLPAGVTYSSATSQPVPFPNTCSTTLIPGSPNQIIIDCPAITNQVSFANIEGLDGYRCGTPQPSTLAPAANGCAHVWGGLANGFSVPVVSNTTALEINSNMVFEGFPLGLGGTNPAIYVSTDPTASPNSQNDVGVAMYQSLNNVQGGKLTINYTGILNTTSFDVSSVDVEHYRDREYPVPSNPPGVLGKIVETTSFEYDGGVSFILESGPRYCINGSSTGANYAWSFSGSLTRDEIDVTPAATGSASDLVAQNLMDAINTPTTNTEVGAIQDPNLNNCFQLTLANNATITTLPALHVGPAAGVNCLVTAFGCSYNPTITLVEDHDIPLLNAIGLSLLGGMITLITALGWRKKKHAGQRK